MMVYVVYIFALNHPHPPLFAQQLLALAPDQPPGVRISDRQTHTHTQTQTQTQTDAGTDTDADTDSHNYHASLHSAAMAISPMPFP